jgi:hypothetical protein
LLTGVLIADAENVVLVWPAVSWVVKVKVPGVWSKPVAVKKPIPVKVRQVAFKHPGPFVTVEAL